MTKVIKELYASTTHKRVEKVVELRNQAKRGKDPAKVTQANRLLERLMQRKCAQVEQATLAGASNLERLADYIIHHELYDTTPYRIANTEYPFMHDKMFDERKAKDTSDKNIEKEFERKAINARRQRTRYENAWMDRRHKAHNKALRDRYNAFKRGETDGVMRVEISDAAIPDGYWLSDETGNNRYFPVISPKR